MPLKMSSSEYILCYLKSIFNNFKSIYYTSYILLTLNFAQFHCKLSQIIKYLHFYSVLNGTYLDLPCFRLIRIIGSAYSFVEQRIKFLVSEQLYLKHRTNSVMENLFHEILKYIFYFQWLMHENNPSLVCRFINSMFEYLLQFLGRMACSWIYSTYRQRLQFYGIFNQNSW